MKKSLLCILVFAISAKAFSQSCTVCTIDVTCDSVPAAPKLCPAELPMDTAQQYYSADLTFYIPQQFQDPQYGTVDLNQIDVLGVTGLPAGMNWTAYDYTGTAATSFFPPANPPSSERGCAKICGTPPMPFDDSITVTVIAYVTVSGVNATQNSSFKVHLKLVPNPSGNSVFTMDNSQACNSLTVNFTPNLQSGGDPLYTYDWNFGNGNTSTTEFPSQTYSAPGDYTVTCTTKVYQYVVTAVSADAVNDDWCGDIEEPYLFGCTGSPDMFFQINSNGGITGSDTIDNNQNPSWSGLNFPLEGNQFIIYFFDEDTGPPFGSPTDSLGYATITASGSGGTYNFSCPSVFGGGTATTGSVTVSLQVKDMYADSDVVHVYAPPSLNPIVFSANDSVCAGDSVLLSVDTGYSYQWYRDTVLLFGGNNSSYYATQSGNYWVEVTNGFGCTGNSSTQNVTIVPLPPMPTFIFMGNNTLKTFISGYALQWYFNGNQIPGATTQTLNYDSSGYYSLSTTNIFCVQISDSVFYEYVEPVGINELAVGSWELEVYPNPNSGKFTIRIMNNEQGMKNSEVKIYNVLGEMVYSSPFPQGRVGDGLFIDISNQPAGIYLLKLQTEKGIINRKIVVE